MVKIFILFDSSVFTFCKISQEVYYSPFDITFVLNFLGETYLGLIQKRCKIYCFIVCFIVYFVTSKIIETQFVM